MLPAASRSHRTRRAVAAVAAFLATVLTVSLGALPAAAASNEYLQLTKTVDRVENVAGDSYTSASRSRAPRRPASTPS